MTSHQPWWDRHWWTVPALIFAACVVVSLPVAIPVQLAFNARVHRCEAAGGEYINRHVCIPKTGLVRP